MAGTKKTITGRKPGLTGRYAYCPSSGTAHALFAKQVEISKNLTMWFRCVCGTRVYFPDKQMIPNLTRAQAIASGAVIPDELESQPMPIPFPVEPTWQPPPEQVPTQQVMRRSVT